MKKSLLSCLFILATYMLVSAQCTSTDLIISQYLEGSSNNKCIEIYNGTGATVDLSNYSIEIYFNANTTPGNTIALSPPLPDPNNVMLAAGDVFVVCDDGETLSITPDLAAGGSFFNGDDNFVLLNGATIIDSFGERGVDPGSQDGSGACGTQNATLSKDLTGPGACPTDTNPNDAFDPEAWAGGGTGCAEQDNIGGLGSAGPLPVELAAFSAIIEEGLVKLNWITVSELDNDYFQVERSQDGQKFLEIGKVEGASTTIEPQVYDFTDARPKSGVNYYRLKQVDFDGTYEYSEVITVNTDIKDGKLEVYPIPTAEILTIETAREISEVKIMDITGKVVMIEQFDAATQLQLNVAKLASGSYFVAIQAERGMEMIRFIKK